MKPTIFILTGLFCLIQTVSFAQNVDTPKDSIYWGTEKLDMLIQIKDYHNLTKDDQVIALLKDFQSRVGEIQEGVPSTPYHIKYISQKQVEILASPIIKSFTISEEKGLSTDFQHRAIVRDARGRYHIELGFNDISEIVAADFPGIITGITAQLPQKDRHLRYLKYNLDENKQLNLTQNRASGYLDMLSLMAGVGANVYKNQFLTDITGEIGLQLNHKGILRNQFYVSNNLMFSFDAESSAVINNFTNIGYRRNFSNQKDKPNWLGVEIGTLTKRSGDLFQPNTMRLGMNWNAGKNITISPQLYFNGLFQQVSPGLRIGIGL
ncbi:MAG TPA: hypothetical protein VK921_17580 [Anditalea sp.]|nr:hypothetical protein [Anditalea sp.]